MSRVTRFGKLIWEHKKKSLFLLVGGYYGLDFLYNRHKNFLMVRALCHESMDQGRRPLPLVAKNKHITLLLNPTSANRKAKWRFEKYAEPMLHLSGFLLNVVRTERISEARDLTQLIERTNVIGVIGGDGTLFEVVTGLLRRDDADEAIRRFPIAIIPVGTRNRFANHLAVTENKNFTEQELIAESTMAVVRHRIKPQDVVQVEVVQPVTAPEDESEVVEKKAEPIVNAKPVYSLSGITLGQYREADHIETNMPGLFPATFARFWSLVRASRKRFKAEIRYTPPCSGCTKCLKEEIPQAQSLISRMTSFLRPSTPIAVPKPKVENPDCGIWQSICVDTLEFNVKPKVEGCLEVELGINTGRIGFIKEGIRRFKGQPPTLSQIFQCSELEIIPTQAPEFCSIDYEEFEFKPLKVKLLRDKIYLFVP